MTPTPEALAQARKFVRTLQLEDGVYCVEMFGHAFIADPEPNAAGAEWLAGKLIESVALAFTEQAQEIKGFRQLATLDAETMEAYQREIERLHGALARAAALGGTMHYPDCPRNTSGVCACHKLEKS